MPQPPGAAEASTAGPDSEEAEKLHFSAFSFMTQLENRTLLGSVYIGYPDRNITVPRITDAKVKAHMPAGAVLLSISYMGFMTREEAAPTIPDADVPGAAPAGPDPQS